MPSVKKCYELTFSGCGCAASIDQTSNSPIRICIVLINNSHATYETKWVDQTRSDQDQIAPNRRAPSKSWLRFSRVSQRSIRDFGIVGMGGNWNTEGQGRKTQQKQQQEGKREEIEQAEKNAEKRAKEREWKSYLLCWNLNLMTIARHALHKRQQILMLEKLLTKFCVRQSCSAYHRQLTKD